MVWNVIGRRRIRTLLSVLLLSAGADRTALAGEYVVIDLGTLGGASSGAWAINNDGEIVGSSTMADGSLHGFLWDRAMTDIRPLAGDTQAQAFDISHTGYVAGMSFDLGELPTNGLLWHGFPEASLTGIAARGVNASGAVVGQTLVVVPDTGTFDRAAVWEAGVLTQLGTLGGDYSYAQAINDTGEAVGKSLLVGNQTWHATLYMGGAVHDLGTLGGATSEAYDINAARQVVGVSDTASSQPHAFMYTVNASGQVSSRVDLGTLNGLDSYAHGINASGVVVGTSGCEAFKWEAGVMTDLNDLLPSGTGWELETARGINDRGWIVGQGKHNGQPRAFLLAPAGDFIPAAAEWGIIALALCLAAGGTVVLLRTGSNAVAT